MLQRVVGRIPVLECLRTKRRAAHRLWMLAGAKGLEPIRAAAGQVPCAECTRRELDALVPETPHQGVILEADPLPIRSIDDWIEECTSAQTTVVVLDGIEDPHNFGAIVRSAAACGAMGVVIGKRRSAPISPASLKSAAGAMEHIDLVEVTNLVRGLDVLKQTGFWSVGLEADAPAAIWETDLSGRIALVVGSEGKGIRRIMREACDFHARIPLTGPITSLNASVSAAIALAECLRQRRPG